MSKPQVRKAGPGAAATGILTVLLLLITAAQLPAQAVAPSQPSVALAEEMNKYPGLMPEFGKLMEKLEREVHLPASRSKSNLLPLMPEETGYFAAFPNYGDAAHQALQVFQRELEQSAVLRDWWQHGDMASAGPKLQDAFEKFYRLSQFLGDEVVISDGGAPDHVPIFIAQVSKPGLKPFLQQMIREVAVEPKPGIRVFDPQELSAAKKSGAKPELVVLVRSDYVIASSDLEGLRRFSSTLDAKDSRFTSLPFGSRISGMYQGGASSLAAADLQSLLRRMPAIPQQNLDLFQHTGFQDMKYLLWEHKNGTGPVSGTMELSFTRPRRGIASWLAGPATLGSLDFVSPQAMIASSIVLKNPALIFDDIKEISSYSNPNSFAGLGLMEQAMNLSLRNDVLSRLSGEITFELVNITELKPLWRVILGLNDSAHLQSTLAKLLMTVPVKTSNLEEQGIEYHSLQIPSQQKPLDIHYAFVDGYLVVGSSHEMIVDSVRLHRSGASLAKSKRFEDSIPRDHSRQASGMLYEDPIAMMALRLRAVAPEIAAALPQRSADDKPVAMWAYGEESAIREVSASAGVDVGAVMVIAAVAIPNLLRARVAANESYAAGAVRSVDTAQVTYSMTYPKQGFARDLATLGPDPANSAEESVRHANMIDAALGGADCTADAWCTKSGFRFIMKATCGQHLCKEYVVIASPTGTDSGVRSFCSTSDGVVRFRLGPPLAATITPAECRSWAPLQ